MKKTVIIIHLLPHEIDWFEWQAKQLKIGSLLVDSSIDHVYIDITLNLNLINWSESRLPKDYFTARFSDITRKYLDWCEVSADIDESSTCNGCADKRRTSIKVHSDATNFIYLDSDLIFKPETLALLLGSAKIASGDYYIISPQITKLWDSSWDVLVNDDHLQDPWDNVNFVDPYNIIATDYGLYSLKQLESFKLGGGWFNLISRKLLQEVGVPERIGPYGPDDTYLMYCCQILKNSGRTVSQYIVENLIVCENHKYRSNIYEAFLKTRQDRTTFRQLGDQVLSEEVSKFAYNLNNTAH